MYKRCYVYWKQYTPFIISNVLDYKQTLDKHMNKYLLQNRDDVIVFTVTKWLW